MTSKRELVLKAFRGEPVDRVPVGFWHHFTSEEEWLAGFGNQAIIDKNLAGHQAFLAEVEPDFIKLMSDGYFAYPNERLKKLQSIKDLADIEPLDCPCRAGRPCHFQSHRGQCDRQIIFVPPLG